MTELKRYYSDKELSPKEMAKKTYAMEMVASEEISRLTKLNMLRHNLGYEQANKLTHIENPELFKQYVSQILAYDEG